MSFKLTLLFVVCFLALTGAIPVEKTEDDNQEPQPVAADPEKEVPQEDPVPEDIEDEKQEDANEEEKQDEEEPEVDDTQEEPENEVEAPAEDENEEPENEVEAPAEDENDESKRRLLRYRYGCKYVWAKKKIHRCSYKLKCSGNYYSKRGYCCRKIRYCRYVRRRVKICKHCVKKCRRVCVHKYRRICRRVRYCGKKNGYYYKKGGCRYVRKCHKVRYPYCRHICRKICKWPHYY